METADKIIRIMIAVVIGTLYYTNVISGIWTIVFIFTTFISFCPLYRAFSINTFKKEK